jgi:hypothetical protein
LTALFGPVVTYNLFVLASTALSGFFAYLLVREQTGSAPAGIVAGVVFAFCPYRMARIAGNLPLVDTHWLPLLFVLLERYIRQRRWTDAALAGLAFALSALSSWYYGVMLVLLVPVYLATRLWRTGRREDWGAWLRGAALFAGVSAILVVPFLLPYRAVQRAGEAAVPLEQAAFWSGGLDDYLVPNPRHVLWGDWVQRHLTPFDGQLPYEFLLGWGWIPSLLALYAWRRKSGGLHRGWSWLIGVAFVLSLGPVLTLFRRVIALPAPDGWAAIWNGALDWLGHHSLAGEPFALAAEGRITLPLPALLLRWIVPGLAGMRSWGRFAILATLGIAVTAGAGTAVFLREEVEPRPTRRPRLRRWAATGLLAGLVFFEFYTGPQELIATGPRPVDVWLSELGEQVTLIQLPVDRALSGPQMYYTMLHGQRIASGYGTYFPILFEEWYPELRDFPADESIDLLAGWGGEGIDLVLIGEEDVPAGDPLWEAIAGQDRLELVHEVGGIKVYRVR